MPFTSSILDNFNRANETPLNATNWQARKNGGGTTTSMRLLSNQAACDSGGGQSYGVWLPLGAMSSCEAYATMVSAADRMDVIGRMKSGVASDFAAYVCATYNPALGGVTLRAYDESGTLPNVTGTVLSWTAAAGDKLGVTFAGMAMTAQVWRGGSWTLADSGTLGSGTWSGWSSVTSGLIGMSIRSTGSGFDDFAGGSTAATTPVADFTGTPISGTVSLSVAFTDTSTNTPTSWAWTFGDGGTSSSQNPSHSYTTSGVYTVALTATNSGGSDTKTRTAYVTVSEAISYASGGGIFIY